jgi:hypothetical protein
MALPRILAQSPKSIESRSLPASTLLPGAEQRDRRDRHQYFTCRMTSITLPSR